MNKILNNSIDELDTILAKEYSIAVKDLYILLTDTYMTILGEDDKPLMSHLYQYNRYYKLIKKLNSILQKLGISEEQQISKAMEDLYIDNSSKIGKEFNLATKVDEEHIKQIIASDWVGDGSNFSDRVWKDKSNMVNKLRSSLIQSITTGQSIGKYSEDLKDYLVNQGHYPIQRLLRTELARIQVQSTLDTYKAAGIKEIKILEAEDERTCELCGSLNGTKVAIDKVKFGSNIPPFHPMCRGTIEAVIV